MTARPRDAGIGTGEGATGERDESGHRTEGPATNGADELDALTRDLLPLITGYLDGIENRPIVPDRPPAEIAERFREPVPEEGGTQDDVMERLDSDLLPNLCSVSHPGYMGLISPSPAPIGMVGDFLASAINQNPGVYSIGPAAVAVERQVVRWLCDLVGYGERAGGHLTSGGTMSLFEAMKVARDRATGGRAAGRGVRQPMSVYTSEERHVAVDKAVDAVGIGRNQLRIVPTDDEFRIDIDALKRAIRSDLDAGVLPAAVVGMAGSTNTGAVDPLEELASVAEEHELWLHVDAAYGGGVLLSDEHRHLLSGIQSADSVTVDPHKWFFAPLGAGGLLIKDSGRLEDSWGTKPEYLREEKKEPDRFDVYARSFEQSRRFRALKVWLGFVYHGRKQLGAWVERNIDLAARLHALCAEHPAFSTAREPTLSVVCARYSPDGGVDPDRLDSLHGAVADGIQRSGRFWLSTTELRGRKWFRVNPVNLHTRKSHIDALFDELAYRCRKWWSESGAG